MKGLLMTPDNAQKCHDGTKTQTRRLIKPQPKIIHEIFTYQEVMYVQTEMLERDKNLLNGCIKCPFSVGEEVYIKETHYRFGHWNKNGFTKTGRQKWKFKAEPNTVVLFTDNRPLTVMKNSFRLNAWYKRPSLFLPADLARTLVTITDIRAQRVQDISEKDARAEGLVHNAFWDMWESPLHPGSLIDWYKTAFKQLWDSIHGEGAWERNDFCWVFDFKRVV